MTDARAGLPGLPAGLLDTEAIRKDFPILDRVLHDGKKLVYLDNAASSQKPRQVLDAMNTYYERHHANVHRGVHVLAEEATELYEGARDKVAAFINAPSRDEVIFTKNASESLNLVANMLGWADEPTGWTPAPRSSSRRWSTTPTSCRGSCSRSAPVRG